MATKKAPAPRGRPKTDSVRTVLYLPPDVVEVLKSKPKGTKSKYVAGLVRKDNHT